MAKRGSTAKGLHVDRGRFWRGALAWTGLGVVTVGAVALYNSGDLRFDWGNPVGTRASATEISCDHPDFMEAEAKHWTTGSTHGTDVAVAARQEIGGSAPANVLIAIQADPANPVTNVTYSLDNEWDDEERTISWTPSGLHKCATLAVDGGDTPGLKHQNGEPMPNEDAEHNFKGRWISVVITYKDGETQDLSRQLNNKQNLTTVAELMQEAGVPAHLNRAMPAPPTESATSIRT